MTNTSKEMLAKILGATGALYGKPVNPMVINLYWRILHKHPWKEVQRAFEAHVEDPDVGQFMPKPADIIRLIKGDTQSQSLRAWTKVARAIGTVGPYRSVSFEDRLIHAVIQEMGGWIKICRVSEKELPFVAKEFQTRYGHFYQNPPREAPESLLGINHHQNAQNGFAVEEPMLIGDSGQPLIVTSRLEYKEPA